MPVSDLHRQVATIAPGAAAEHGFALGGGNALIAHELISRPTQDDLVTNHETGVAAAAGPVQAALHDAGLSVVRRGDSPADVFPGFSETLVDLDVTAPDGQQTTVELVYFDRTLNTVTSDIGPVLHIEDALASKVCALARAYERDYIDTAAALQRYTPNQLISFARRLDPGLDNRDFADAGQRLDQIPDKAFAAFGLTRQAVTTLRERFAAWPRAAETSEPQQGTQGQRAIGEPDANNTGPAPDADPQRRQEEREADWGGPEIEP